MDRIYEKDMIKLEGREKNTECRLRKVSWFGREQIVEDRNI